MRQVIDSTWFDGIGLVATKNDMGEVKFYIGRCFGMGIEVDEKHIADYGTRVDPKCLKEFIDKNIKEDESKK